EKDFEEVFEVSFTTKSAEEGTGLGLAIARRFIRAYGGELSVEMSVPNERTVFLIEMPTISEESHQEVTTDV
ncbi:MAG TPA: ATP-binding protein, partial [Oligoflexia bacterium]|nr:ATP-binding protein [Oligoflexia bacterium]